MIVDKDMLLDKEEIKKLRSFFSGSIKENFLIEILLMVLSDKRFAAMLLNDVGNYLSIESYVKGKTYSYIDICKMIVMCHYKNVIMLSESEKGTFQSKYDYKSKLVDEVIEMYKLKPFAAQTFSAASFEPYYPLIYYISALNNYCAMQYDEHFDGNKVINNNINKEFSFKLLPKLLLKVRSCVSLADIRSTDDLIVIYRSLIELFMTYAALWDADDKAIESYYFFDQLTFNYNRDKPIPDKYKTMAKEYGESNPVSFINYGWIKDLPLFGEIEQKKNMFKLGTLGKILDKKYGHIINGFGTGLYNLFKSCNPQTHGTSLNMNYFELEISIFQNISIMMKFMCTIMKDSLFGFDYKVLGVDLVDRMDYLQHESEKIFQWVYMNDESEYKTNVDYRNRAICSLRIA